MADSAEKVYSLKMSPGILRDGTLFSKANWTDGQWTRFYRKLPKKIGGYRQITIPSYPTIPNPNPDLPPIPVPAIQRSMIVIPNSGAFSVYTGDQNGLNVLNIDFQGNQSAPMSNVRTPVGFLPDVNNTWNFDVMYDATTNTSVLLAVAMPNLFAIDNTIQRPIYSGDILGVDPLTSTGQSVSGGIFVMHPYLFMLDNDGFVRWSNANNPRVILGSDRIAPYKLVCGLATRGGNSSPAGLIWSLDRLIRVTNVGSTAVQFSFDTVSGESSIIASNSVVEYDGVFYWIGVDSFLTYNGNLQELPNDMNILYFFKRLNFSQRQKIWATKITKYGEIWWHYPSGNNTECDSALIYSTRERTWFDTSSFRSCGYYSQVFTRPIWADNQLDIIDNLGYPIWMHEIGVDADRFGSLTAIPASFKSGTISFVGLDANQQNSEHDVYTYLSRFEPDFLQVGDMTMVVGGRDYARSADVPSGPYTFSPTTEAMDVREERRELTLTFASDALNGDFEMGQCLMTIDKGIGRPPNPSP